MNLKATILKNKFKKTNAGILDAFLMEQVYSLIEQLVVEENKEVAKKYTTDFEQKVLENKAELEGLIKDLKRDGQKLTSDAKDNLLTIIRKNVDDVAKLHEQHLTNVQQIHKESIAGILDKLNKLYKDVETFRGERGLQGIPGKKGEDGSPDTPDQVVDKVNQSKKKIKMTAVDGLDERFKSIKKMGGGKSGGGMGNVQHETKPVGSATTVVNLDYSVAAGGRAAWLYYQGQFLFYGTHYTISGSTVTLLFTPVDSTNLDITYIR